MSMREDADYSDAYSQEGAEMSVGNAKGFLREVERILSGEKERAAKEIKR